MKDILKGEKLIKLSISVMALLLIISVFVFQYGGILLQGYIILSADLGNLNIHHLSAQLRTIL